MVLQEEEEEEEEECEEDFAVEYVEYDNCLWGREWDPARQRYCWWLASADGSQVGHAIWRPPWLIGCKEYISNNTKLATKTVYLQHEYQHER